MRAADLMTAVTHVCRPVDTLRDAAELLWEHDCGCLPVVDATNHVVGMVTDRDVCLQAFRAGGLERARVAQIMSEPVWTCSPAEGVDRVASRMRKHGVRRLPVVDDHGRLQGILSLDDLARAAIAVDDDDLRFARVEDVARTLAVFGQPRVHHRETNETGGPPKVSVDGG